MTITEPAYAKLNLSLDILGQRPDGYHDLKMVMQSVSLHDTVSVTFRAGTGITLATSLGYLPRDSRNIAVKAAQAFFQGTGIAPVGLTIRLDKRIPVAAGMAGGSSDGAAVLRLLRRALAPELPEADLSAIALAVGSDVPYCLRGGTALAEGRGEVLTDLPPLPDCAVVLCKPDFGLPTPELFARVDGADLGDRPDASAMAAALARGDLAAAAGCLGNVFEQVLTPEEGADIRAIRAALLECGALGATMSGSGPTVFGLFGDPALADRAAQVLGERYRQTYLAGPVKKFGELE